MPATSASLEGAQRSTVDAADAGQRLDTYVAQRSGAARNRVSSWIALGAITVNDEPVRRSRRLIAGDVVVIDHSKVAASRPGPLRGEPWPETISVLGETSDFVVLDKPAGIVVHPGAGHSSGTLANFVVGRWPQIAHIGHEQRPGIVHRLDVGTTGAMAVARSNRGFQELSTAFAERRIVKLYIALVYGALNAPLEIELPIDRHPTERKKMAVRRTGRPAHSSVIPIARAAGGGISLVGVRLHTGRTHQIRVHLKAASHPLVGDPTYGEARWKALAPKYRKALSLFPRPALHAWHLRFLDPSTSEQCSYTATAPTDLRDLWQGLDQAQSLNDALSGTAVDSWKRQRLSEA